MMDKINALFDSSEASSVLIQSGDGCADPNFYYFAEISRAAGFAGFLVLRRGRKPVVAASVLEYGEVRKNRNLQALQFGSKKEAVKILGMCLKEPVGINYSGFTVSGFQRLKKNFPGKKFLDISGVLPGLRELKTNNELKKIGEACAIAEETLEKIPDIAKPGMSEAGLASELNYISRKSGGESEAFPTIVAAGKNASVPHHKTNGTKILRGSVLLVDFGAVFDGYCSDLTRMFFVGKPDENVLRAYSAVYRAQRESIGKIKAGAKAGEIFGCADKLLKDTLGQNLIHGVGHGVGIDVHDFPASVGRGSDYSLKERMCLTIEPAYYGKEYGIRIEDVLVVTKGGHKLLSDAPKDLISI